MPVYFPPLSPTVGALDDIPDVDAPSPNDGDVLTFIASSGNWEAAAPSGGSGAGPSDTHAWMPLTSTDPSTGDPALVWDANDNLIPTFTPI
jgi:hypothetical protein